MGLLISVIIVIVLAIAFLDWCVCQIAGATSDEEERLLREASECMKHFDYTVMVPVILFAVVLSGCADIRYESPTGEKIHYIRWFNQELDLKAQRGDFNIELSQKSLRDKEFYTMVGQGFTTLDSVAKATREVSQKLP